MAKETRTVVYGLFDPESHELRYVGVTSDLAARYRQHVNEARCKSGGSCAEKEEWIRDLLQRRMLPAMVVLEVTTKALSRRCERKWISRMQGRGHSLTNRRVGSTLTRAEIQAATPINYALLQLVETAAEIFDRGDADPIIKQLGQSFWKAAKKARAFIDDAIRQ